MIARWSFRTEDSGRMQTARDALAELLLRCADGDIDACLLAYAELVSNAIRHAPAGRIRVTLDWSRPQPVLSVRDPGKGFVPVEPRLPSHDAEGGRGLYIVKAFAGAPDVVRVRAGCIVSVPLPVRRRAAAC